MPMSTFISARQVKAARMLLNWSQQHLADQAGLGVATIRRFESDSAARGYLNTANVIKEALENGGVNLLPENEHDGLGVRLKKTK